jgi:hypothetical protein
MDHNSFNSARELLRGNIGNLPGELLAGRARGRIDGGGRRRRPVAEQQCLRLERMASFARRKKSWQARPLVLLFFFPGRAKTKGSNRPI